MTVDARRISFLIASSISTSSCIGYVSEVKTFLTRIFSKLSPLHCKLPLMLIFHVRHTIMRILGQRTDRL